MMSDGLHEIQQPGIPVTEVPAGVPEIPGGWTYCHWDVGDVRLKLLQPAEPDAFLNDPAVLDAHEKDGYMPYWAYLWPAAFKMANCLTTFTWRADTRILELGCGVGLVGLCAASKGWQVTLTDYDPVAVQVAACNASEMGLTNVTTEILDWRAPGSVKYPVIIGCELIYEDRNHEMLLNLLEHMLQDDGIVWMGDAGRTRAPGFYEMAKTRGWHIQLFNEQMQPVQEMSFGKFQLLVLTRKGH